MTSIGITPQYEKKAEEFYRELLKTFNKLKLPFIIGGTYALQFYTEIDRPTKDIDIFCKASDYPTIMRKLAEVGYKIEIRDDRWLCKVKKGKYFADIIFGAIPTHAPIDDDWLKNAQTATILGQKVKITPPEELIVSKAYRMGRTQFDGADVTHIILKQGKTIDWKRLRNRMEPNWEVLLAQIELFRFTYPTERNTVPEWLLTELMQLIESQMALPTPKDPVCRGSLLSHEEYQVAYTDWQYKDITDFHFKYKK